MTSGKRIARAGGVRLVGPNCIGLVSTGPSCALSVNAVLEYADIRKGPLAIVSQSGSMIGGLMSRGLGRGVGFSKLISVGNEADLGVGEIADLLVDDPHTGTILLLPTTARAVTPTGRRVVVVPEGTFLYRARRRVFYEVRSGDSLPAIASAFGVQQTELLGWNALDAGARLAQGMMLQIFVERERALAGVRYVTEDQAAVLVAGAGSAASGRKRSR